MNLVLSGGVLTVAIGAAICAGFARVYDARRLVYWIIFGFVVLVCVFSLLLPEENIFRDSVAHDVTAIFWWLKIGAPVLLYFYGISWIRKKVDRKHDT